MEQMERNWLYKVAYSLDNRTRIKGYKEQLFVVFTHEELTKLAEDIRKLAEADGSRLLASVNGRRK